MRNDDRRNPHFFGLHSQVPGLPATQSKAYLMSQTADQAEDMPLGATSIAPGDKDKNIRLQMRGAVSLSGLRVVKNQYQMLQEVSYTIRVRG